MTHIARPAPERMPNTNTTTPMVIFAGRLGHSTSVSTVTMGKPLSSQGPAPTSRRKRLGPTRAPCCREVTRWPRQFIPSGLSVAIHPPSGPLLGVRGCAVQLPRGRSARRPGRCDYAAPDCWGHASEDPGSSRRAPPALGPAHSAPRTRKLRQSKNSLDGRAPSGCVAGGFQSRSSLTA
jgi:hypothetical protein